MLRGAGAVDRDQLACVVRKVQRLRAEVDAIAVGVGTMLVDDPRLTVRGRVSPAAFRQGDLRPAAAHATHRAGILDARFRPCSSSDDAAQAETRPEQASALERAGACIERTDGTLDAASRGWPHSACCGAPRGRAPHPPGRRRSGLIDEVRLYIAPNALGPGRGADGGRRETLDPRGSSRRAVGEPLGPDLQDGYVHRPH